MPVNFQALHRDDDYFERLDNNIWLMDNHKWAICAWEEYRREAAIERLGLVHVDYHWDACDDYHGQLGPQHVLRAADVAGLRDLVQGDVLIRYDSFIAPAVRRRMLRDIHFLCRQEDADQGLDPQLLRRCGARQHIYGDAEALAAKNVVEPYVFDLCLDYFNDADGLEGVGVLWADADINGLLHALRPMVEAAAAVTVSLSFDYSGSEEDTHHLAQVAVPLIEAWR